MPKIIMALPVMALALLAGCHSTGTHVSASAQAHAVASSSAGALGRQVVARCVPSDSLGQLRWLERMASGPHSKHAQQGEETRAKFAVCAGVQKSKMPAFENAALTAGEGAVTQRLLHHDKGAIQDYLDNTLPALVVKYRG